MLANRFNFMMLDAEDGIVLRVEIKTENADFQNESSQQWAFLLNHNDEMRSYDHGGGAPGMDAILRVYPESSIMPPG